MTDFGVRWLFSGMYCQTLYNKAGDGCVFARLFLIHSSSISPS